MTHIEMSNLIGDIEEQEFEERQGYYEEPEELIEIEVFSSLDYADRYYDSF